MKELLKSVTFSEILIGLKETLKHLFTPAVTVQYPYEKRELPSGYRGMLSLLRYSDGAEKCVGCDLCEAACPSRVITVVSAEMQGEPTKRYAKEYYMDMTRCIFCGLCVTACPVDALGMTKEYEWAVYDKRSLLLNKEQLLDIGDRSFPERERPVQDQYHNVETFNIGRPQLPPKHC